MIAQSELRVFDMRVALTALGTWLVAEVVGPLTGGVNTVIEWIILASALLVALGVIYRKAVVPTVKFFVRVDQGVDVILEMPTFRKDVLERLEKLEREAQRQRALDDA